jgi:succinate-acetate transporter protein
VFIFFGGLIQILGGIGEWMIGNTFSCALFFTYGTFHKLLSMAETNDLPCEGTFWIVQGTSLMPLFATGLLYSPTANALEGMHTPSYNASVGVYTQAGFEGLMSVTDMLYCRLLLCRFNDFDLGIHDMFSSD